MGAVEQVVARLKSACEAEPGLRGALIQHGELKDGTLWLSGTVDRTEQAAALEALGKRWLDDTPPWKQQIPQGIKAAKLVVFPIRSEVRSGLQLDFAKASADPRARPGLLQQTRIDDLYFDAQGRLRAAGLCINQRAYLAQKHSAAPAADNPLAQIAQAIRDHLKSHPLPVGVNPNVIARLQADKITFQENPVRPLQRRANQSSQLDDVLFRDAWFDAEGALKLDGLLGDESLRDQAAALLRRPEFVRAYSRLDGKPPAEPPAAITPMAVVPWRKTLLSGLQHRFARDANRGAPTDDLRYCRVDRAMFVYPNQGGLLLRFEGVALRPNEETASARIATGLRDECRGLFQPPIPIEYNIEERMARLPSPVRQLQSSVAADPALDGVRLDDLTFGPKGEAVFEGLWLGPQQETTLAAVLTPKLAEQSGNKVGGPLTWRLREMPTDQWLRQLRRQAAAIFDETSLDRFVFQLAKNPEASPELTLHAATIESSRSAVEARLTTWLREGEPAKTVGTPRVQLTSRPSSLVRELRKLIASERTLDGVRIDRGVFIEDNAFVLSGLQDHDGQAERAVSLVREAAARAWPNLSPPAVIRAGRFTTFSLRPLLNHLSRSLPYYPEADGILLNRAYYDADSALVLAGRDTISDEALEGLKVRIKALIGIEPKLDLISQPRDPESTDRLVVRAIEALVAGNLAGVGADALDQAILLNPTNSTAWYLRAAYYYGQGDHELAWRDISRVASLERSSSSRLSERSRSLERFQGPLRLALEEMVRKVGDSGR